jgi:hypothetical protein
LRSLGREALNKRGSRVLSDQRLQRFSRMEYDRQWNQAPTLCGAPVPGRGCGSLIMIMEQKYLHRPYT